MISNESLDSSDTNHSSLDPLGQAWARMVDCLIHDLTTPLVTLRMTASGLDNIFASLIEGYKLAVKNNLMEPNHAITEGYLTMLEQVVGSGIEPRVNDILNFLKLTHSYKQKLFSNSKNIQVLNIKTCIEKILESYPFSTEKDHALIYFNCQYDFQFLCDPFFIEHLLMHLIDNALRSIEQKEKGEINLWTEQTNGYNTLYYKKLGRRATEF